MRFAMKSIPYSLPCTKLQSIQARHADYDPDPLVPLGSRVGPVSPVPVVLEEVLPLVVEPEPEGSRVGPVFSHPLVSKFHTALKNPGVWTAWADWVVCAE